MFIISFLETGKKSLNNGAIPKLNLPEKSHKSRKFKRISNYPKRKFLCTSHLLNLQIV